MSTSVLSWEIMTRGEVPYRNLNKNEIISYLERGERLQKPKLCDDKFYIKGIRFNVYGLHRHAGH